jgi:hypothetical protein
MGKVIKGVSMRFLRMFLIVAILVGGVSACSSTSKLLEVQSAAEQDSDFVALKSRFEDIGLVCERRENEYSYLDSSELAKLGPYVGCMDPDLEYDDFFQNVGVIYVPGPDGEYGVRALVAAEFCSDKWWWLYFHPDGKFVIDWGGHKFSWDEKSSLMGVTPLSWWKFCGQKAVDTYKTIAPVIDVETRDACQRISSVYEEWLSSGERLGTVKGNAKYDLLVSELTDTLAPTGPLKTRVGDESITDAYRYLDSSGTAFDPVHVYAGLLNFATRLVGVRADYEDILWSPDVVQDTYLQYVKRPCGNFK